MICFVFGTVKAINRITTKQSAKLVKLNWRIEMRLQKETLLSNGRKLFVWFANNKGRGDNNCTLAVVDWEEKRASRVAGQKGFEAMTTTSAWRGNINLSEQICKELGITKDMIAN